MTLRFLARKPPKSLDGFDKQDRAQLVVFGKAWDGQSLPAERRYSKAPADKLVSCLGGVEIWTVMDGDRIAYVAWFANIDDGIFFAGRTTRVVARLIQRGVEWEKTADKKLRHAVHAFQPQAPSTSALHFVTWDQDDDRLRRLPESF